MIRMSAVTDAQRQDFRDQGYVVIPSTFTLLAGVWLTDQARPHHGNLWIWPGTHLRYGA